MKRTVILITATLFLAVGLTATAQQRRGGGANGSAGTADGFASDITTVLQAIERSPVTQTEIDGLFLMREEEKLARDVYSTLGELWNIRMFSNIARSEQTHMDAVYALFERYELKDPVASDSIGEFTDPLFAELYSELVEKGTESIEEAYKVGAMIEELDIADLNRLIGETDNEDIKIVYQNLNKGSRNHLRSFNSQISRVGASYSPSYLSAGEYNEIVSSPREAGPVNSDSGVI
jgi:hypothetical protein